LLFTFVTAIKVPLKTTRLMLDPYELSISQTTQTSHSNRTINCKASMSCAITFRKQKQQLSLTFSWGQQMLLL